MRNQKLDGPFVLSIAGRTRASTETAPVVNPADGTVVADAPIASAADLSDALAAATAAFPAWSDKSIKERGDYLRTFAQAVSDHLEELATLLTLEQGKPRHSLAAEEMYGAIEFLTGTADLDLPVQVLRDGPELRVEAHRVPLGVVAAITPWNMPVVLSIAKLAPNLLAGNTIILKPAPTTPLTLLRIGELANSIFPPGVLNVVSGGDLVGRRLSEDPAVKKITFTGSTAVGKQVLRAAADGMKRVVLELGGNDPAIVLPDADWRAIVPRLFWGAFYNSGQVCIATKRLYVHEGIYDEFLREFVEFAKTITVGDGMDGATDLGPVQNREQYGRVAELIADCRANGYEFAYEGITAGDEAGYFIPVTIIDNPPEDSRIVQEEQFGPVLPILRYSTVDEAVQRANATTMGLAASVWGPDAPAVANRLNAGTVWINGIHVFGPDIPLGGHQESGFSVERGVAGLEACTNLKILTHVSSA
ncbi:aldehyde dehydrogenase family protein [Nocardia sp. NPDC055049]